MRFVRVLLSYSVDVSRKHSGDQILAQEVQQSTINNHSAAQRSADDDPRTRPTPRVACRHYRPSPGPTTIALNLAKALLAR